MMIDAGRAGEAAANRESAAGPERRIDSICAAADLRDGQALVRDFQADQRDAAANFEAFVHGDDDAGAYEARELAHRDRLRSRADRVAAELDRFLLGDLGSNGDLPQEAS